MEMDHSVKLSKFYTHNLVPVLALFYRLEPLMRSGVLCSRFQENRPDYY